MNTNSTRRQFLQQTTGATLSGFILAGAGRHAAAAASTIFTRREVNSSAAIPIVAAYRTAVQAMQNLAATDPRSWTYQASMHGTYDAVPAGALWNQCQHGSYLFLSWHRMYLYFFERIVRSFSGMPDQFALPYWNYSSPLDSQRALPAPFRSPAGADNALFVAERNTTDDGGLEINAGDPVPYSATLFSAAFRYRNFYSNPGSSLSFGGQAVSEATHFDNVHGQIEGQPHDVMHGMIGGSGWMGDPNLAARDPIFWLHHANIDRLWKRWLGQNAGQANPTQNDFWMNNQFQFYDENRQLQVMTGKAILDTVEQLNYQYDDDPSPVIAAAPVPQSIAVETAIAPPPTNPTVLSTLPEPKHTLGTGSKTFSIPLADDARPEIHRLATAIGVKQRLVLRIEGLEFDAHPGIFYEVYLNLPADAEPNHQSLYYLGNIGFFGPNPDKAKAAAGHVHKGGTTYGFDVTDLVKALKAKKLWKEGQLDVTFVPRGLESKTGKPTKAVVPEKSNIRFAGISIVRE